MFWAAFVDYEWFCHQILKGLKGKQHQTTVGACRNERVKKSTIVLANLEPIPSLAAWCIFVSLRFSLFSLALYKRGSQGYVDGIEFFDHKFFGISNVEAMQQGGKGAGKSVIRFFDVYIMNRPIQIMLKLDKWRANFENPGSRVSQA